MRMAAAAAQEQAIKQQMMLQSTHSQLHGPSHPNTVAAMAGAALAQAQAAQAHAQPRPQPAQPQSQPQPTPIPTPQAAPGLSAAQLALQQQTLAAIAHAETHRLSITLTPQQLASLTPEQIAALKQRQRDLAALHAQQRQQQMLLKQQQEALAKK